MKVTIELEHTNLPQSSDDPKQESLDTLIIGVLPDIQGAWERNEVGSGFIYDDNANPVGRWTTTEKKS